MKGKTEMKHFKKITSLFLALLMVISACAAMTVSTSAGGADTDIKADFTISSAKELIKVLVTDASANGYYKGKTVALTNDIDMNNSGFTMIAEFHGTLDGKGHAIKNLSMQTDGFIRKLMDGAVIRNISFVNASQTKASDTGILALSATGVVEFNNVYVQGSVTTTVTHNKTGGFLSWTNTNSSVTFTDCVSAVTATGTRAGGFVGQTNKNTSVVFNDCSFIGDLSGGTQWSSNFAGLTVGNVEMNRCVSLGKSSTHNESGVFVYLDHQNSATNVTANIKLNDCYAAVADGRYAVGAHATRSFCQTLTVSYGGTQAIKIEATAQANNIASKRNDLEATMQYIAKGTTVYTTAKNFYEKCPALANWVLTEETVAYGSGINVVKVAPRGVYTKTLTSPVGITGIQTRPTADSDDKYDVRLVGLVNFEDMDKYATVGFKWEVKSGNKLLDSGTVERTGVFSSIIANGETVTAEAMGAEAIYLANFGPLENGYTFDITVTAFAKTADGTVIYDYSGANTISVCDGVLAS